ncbi:MAG: amino acid permease, partial [Gammaproteobacteria bacterium]
MTAPNPALKRSIGSVLLTLYGVGTILGAGIYVLVGEVAGRAGIYAPLSFALAALLALFSAFSYAELAARFPVSAGEAVYVEEAFQKPGLSALIGYLVVTIGLVSSATLVHGFTRYLGVFVIVPDWLVLGSVTLCLGLIAIWGVKESLSIAAIMTLVEVFGLLLVVWVGAHNMLERGIDPTISAGL